nr:NUDIX hydrolase [Micromonospora sp. DSM 115978]
TFQPMVGTADAENVVYLARGAVRTGEQPDVNEAQEIAWIPLSSVPEKIRSGEIVGSASVTGLLYACARVGVPLGEF